MTPKEWDDKVFIAAVAAFHEEVLHSTAAHIVDVAKYMVAKIYGPRPCDSSEGEK